MVKKTKTNGNGKTTAKRGRPRKAQTSENVQTSNATTEEVASDEEAETTITVSKESGAPLTTSEIKKAIPAAFVKPSDDERKNLRSFVPTTSLLKFFEKLGWKPVIGQAEWRR